MNEVTVTKHNEAVQERRAPRPVSGWAVSPRRNPATQAAYEKRVNTFFKWLDDHAITDPTAADIERFAGELADLGRSAYCLNGYLAAIRSYFRYLQKNRLWLNVAEGVEGAKIERGHKKDKLTAEQVQRVVAGSQDARERAMLMLLLTTGMRSCEIVRADVGHLSNQTGATILYVWGKGRAGISSDEFVVLVPEVADALYAYLNTRGALPDTAPLFASSGNRNAGGRMTTRTVRRIVTEAFKRANCYREHRLTTHSTRHTAIQFAVDAGVPLQDVQAMARHASINTTMIYASANARVKSGAEARVAAAMFASIPKDEFSDIGGAA